MTVSPSYRAEAMGLARRAGVESNRLVWPTEGDLFEGTFSRTLAKPGSSYPITMPDDSPIVGRQAKEVLDGRIKSSLPGGGVGAL